MVPATTSRLLGLSLLGLWFCTVVDAAATSPPKTDLKQVQVEFRSVWKATDAKKITDTVSLDTCKLIPDSNAMGDRDSLLYIAPANPVGWENMMCRVSTTENCTWDAAEPAKASKAFNDKMVFGDASAIYRSYKCVDSSVDGWKAKLGVK